jgi:DNA-binding PadR family transcriptional regulator
MSRKGDPLSTSAYAVLSLLALRSWTGYELTQQAKRSLHFVWPKAESLLYAQPPRLVAAGFAQVEVEEVGGRKRNRYTITRAGRAALRRWLMTAPDAPHFEAEPVLRFAFADLGTTEDARRSIDSLRQSASAQFEHGLATMESLGDDNSDFPERDHLNVLLGHLFGNISRSILEWCDLAEAELQRWNDVDDPGPAARTSKLLADLLAEGRAFRAQLDAGDGTGNLTA